MADNGPTNGVSRSERPDELAILRAENAKLKEALSELQKEHDFVKTNTGRILGIDMFLDAEALLQEFDKLPSTAEFLAEIEHEIEQGRKTA